MKPGPFDWLSDLPAALRFVRQARRLSLRDVAKETGIPTMTISRLERGQNDVQFQTAMRIANWIASSAPIEESK